MSSIGAAVGAYVANGAALMQAAVQAAAAYALDVDGKDTSVPKSRTWFREVVPLLDEYHYGRWFRLSRASMRMISERLALEPEFQPAPRVAHSTVPVDEALHMAVYRLTRWNSLHNIAGMFGRSEGLVSQVTEKVWKVICRVFKHKVDDLWPTSERARKELAEGMSKVGKSNFPNCLGAMDGTALQTPLFPGASRTDYWCYKGFYAVTMLVRWVCVRHVP
jgi:hypothetical protein